jgi:hypothetical protein
MYNSKLIRGLPWRMRRRSSAAALAVEGDGGVLVLLLLQVSALQTFKIKSQ